MATSENLKDAAGNADPSPPSLPGTGTSSPAPTSAGNARRQAFLRSASIPTLEQSAAPRLKPRWLFAEGKGKGWATFGLGDSGRIEKGWGEWRGEVREGKVQAEHEQEQEGEGEKEGKHHFDFPPADPTQPLPSWRVPVGEDRLFEVDVRSSPPSSSSSSSSPTTPGMHPVFWRGPRVEVRRGEWFFESSRLAPCPAELSRELEEHYAKIGPWTSAYADELKASASIGAEGEEKLICRLTTLKSSYVIFSGSHLARIYTEGMSTRLAKTLLTAWAGEHGGGTVVVRGYDQVQKLLKARRGDVSSGGSGKKQKGKYRGGAGTGEGSQTSTPVKGVEQQGQQQQQGEKRETEEGAAAKAGGESSDTQQSSTDIWTSLTSKFNSWSSTTKAQQDAVAASFKEAQRHTQDLPPADRDSEVEAASDDSDDEEAHELALEREAESEEVELVFCWHGIGQKLAEEWKSLEFSLAVNSFKSLLRKRAHAPPPAHVGGEGMAKLTRGKRLVLVPIDWRTTLNDFKPGRRGGGGQEGEGEEEEDEEEPPQLEDIFGPPSSIPLARQITKNLLLDIPLYLSHHKAEVLRRCIAATNRAYALFLQRNPGFNPSSSTKKKGGKVSLICHSLGCAIAVDVLSAQPSTVGEGKRELAEITMCKHLAFDVRNLYFCGSPAALFFYLESRQLVARRRHGRGRGRGHDAPDEGEGKPSSSSSSSSLDRPTWGSLPVSSIWNVLHSTDPIGTHLNGCVDRHYARERAGPVQVDRVVEAVLGGLEGAKTVASSRVNKGEKAGAGRGREGPSGSSGFFGSWGRTTETSTAVAAQDKAASGASSPTTPPADLGEVPTNKKAKRKSGATSGLLSKGKDGLGLDAVTTATASLKAQQWAAKFAQSKLTGTTTTTSTKAQPAAATAAGSEDGEETTPGPSDPTEVEHAGKTSYPPPPVPAPVEADAQLAEEMEEAMQDAKPQAEGKTKGGLAGDDATKPEVEEEEGETIAQHRAKERDEGREEGKATTARDTGEDHEDEHKLSATRRERAHDRFLALNPIGRIDYILPKPAPSLLVPAAMLEYVQMLQAHAGYWSSEAFADFVLATSAIRDDDGDGDGGDEDGEEGEKGKGKGKGKGVPTWGEVRARLFGDADAHGEGQ